MNENQSQQDGQSFDQPDHEQARLEPRERDEILQSMLEQTKSHLDSDSLHEKLTHYVRENRLPSNFEFENVCELVRCILESTKIDQLSIDFEDCVNWIAKTLYDDPLANERLDRLWNSIVLKIQG